MIVTSLLSLNVSRVIGQVVLVGLTMSPYLTVLDALLICSCVGYTFTGVKNSRMIYEAYVSILVLST